jgi:hypothetical protein
MSKTGIFSKKQIALLAHRLFAENFLTLFRILLFLARRRRQSQFQNLTDGLDVVNAQVL